MDETAWPISMKFGRHERTEPYSSAIEKMAVDPFVA